MISIHMPSVAAIGAALATLLPAQTAASPNANRFIPADSTMVLRVASPAKWRKQFGGTHVAKLGEAQSLAPVMNMVRQRFEMGLEEMRDSGMVDADLVESLLDSWQGDIIMAARIDWEALFAAMQEGNAPPISGVLGMTPDGSFDLAPIQKELYRLCEDAPNPTPFKDFMAGDLAMRRTVNENGQPDTAFPVMVDGHVLMLFGTDLEKIAPKLLSKEARYTQATDGLLCWHFNIAKLIPAVMPMVADRSALDAAAMMDALGFTAMQDVQFSLQPDGKTLAGEIHIGMKKDGRGVFNLMAKSKQPPKLLNAVPPNSEAFSVSSIDISALFRTFRDVWSTLGEFAPMTFQEALDIATEATKVRLKEDLLDNLGNEFLSIQDVEGLKNMDPDDMEDNPAAMLSGSVYGLSLRDGEAFGAALEKMLRSRGMHVGRKTQTYANVEVHRMKVAGLIELEYAVTKDLLLLAIGGTEGTARILRDVLDTRASGDATGPAVLAKRATELAPGWNGIGITPIGAVLEGAMAGMQASGRFGDMDMATQMMRGVVSDMNRLGIGSVLQASYCDDQGFTARFRW